MERKRSETYNIKAVNSIIQVLSNKLSTVEADLKKEMDKNDELNSIANMLSDEIQQKAIEITKLK